MPDIKNILEFIASAALVGLVVFVFVILIAGIPLSGHKAGDQKEYLLRSYALENERVRLENERRYLRVLELSCTSEFINQYGEVYSRKELK